MAFIGGLVLGLAMIVPIGPQNAFVFSQGLLGGVKRGLLAALVAGLCDTALILLGAAGLSAVLIGFPWFRQALLVAGALFLLYLGIRSLRKSVDDSTGEEPVLTSNTRAKTGSIVLAAIGVSWGNPHAISDTVIVLGSAIAAHNVETRSAFVAGTVSASWLFFGMLALVGALFHTRITARTQVWVQRASGIVMLVFAAFLGRMALLG